MQHQQIAVTLAAITAQMQEKVLWQDIPPSKDKLASKLPFCVDTLTFSQWLQWVMFPKLFVIIETKAALPNKSNMAVMAEQAFKAESADTKQLLVLIKQLDKHISGE
jgi:uncharacterized protein YqcC (DUF446 family)